LRPLTRFFLPGFFAALLIAGLAAQAPKKTTVPIQDYIRKMWSVLTRSNRNLAAAAVDPKFKPLPNGRWPVYLPAKEDAALIQSNLRREMAPADFAKIEIRKLPNGAAPVEDQGLLYLPRPYVVPGGRFNEM